MPAGPALIDVLPRLAAALDGSGPALLPVAANDPRAAGLVAALRPGAPLASAEDDRDDPTALVVATSGSTGPAKGALLPRSALAASAEATAHRLGGAGSWLLALPAQHIAGMQVLLRSVAAGTAPAVLDTAVPFTAGRFTAAVKDLTAPVRYVSLVPTQLHRILADADSTAAAAEFDAVLVGGAPCPPALLRRARSAGINVVTTYGMSETCGGCVYDGRPLDGVQARISAGAPGGSGAPGGRGATGGRIVLAGPVIARGYRGLPGHPSFATPGEFVTDDVGICDQSGLLRVIGRADDAILSGGHTVHPTAVEAALARAPGVGEISVVGIPDPVWGEVVTAVVVPAATGPSPSLATLHAAAPHLPDADRPRRLVLVRALPLRGPGKPDRAAILAIATRAAAESTPADR